MAQRKRYQIFVSSTFEDLKKERGTVMETILNFDCFPAGMELFPAMDEEQFEYIKRIIDDSDYYLLIIGGRYGSVDENGVSWTEKEYDYAVSKGIPVIVFDHIDITRLPASKTDQDDKKRKKLITFKKKVASGRLIKKWSNKDDLALAIATSLKSVLYLQPRIGWVRADSIPGDDSQKEIDRLQKEIIIHLDEIKRLEANVKDLESALRKNGDGNHTLESSYQAIKEQTKNLEEQNKKYIEQIKSLNSELEKYRKPQIDIGPKSLPQIEIINIPGIDVSFRMVFVEGGTFMMGANKGDTEAFYDEKSVHEVKLSDFWIGETLVTQALWQAVMGGNPSKFKGDPNLPVENVSWNDCQVFIKELNRLTSRKFRLPSEAQWEFAARGGNLSKGFKYAGGDNTYDVAWFYRNSERKTHPVKEKLPNELGLFDMSGNVCEYCKDWYASKYSSSQNPDPTGPSKGVQRVCRGGCWEDSARKCRISLRISINQTEKSNHLGLRLAL